MFANDINFEVSQDPKEETAAHSAFEAGAMDESVRRLRKLDQRTTF